MKKSMRKILSGFLALALCVTTVSQGMGNIFAQEETGPTIEGLTVKGPWNYDNEGLHLAWSDDNAVVSTAEGGYGVGEYQFNLYSGRLNEGDRGTLYFMNKSADTPNGNGNSLCWDKDGIYLCDSKGNVVFNWTEAHDIIKSVWQANS